MGHALTDNRYGFAAAATVTHASGTAEREAALALMDKTADPSPEPARFGNISCPFPAQLHDQRPTLEKADVLQYSEKLVTDQFAGLR